MAGHRWADSNLLYSGDAYQEEQPTDCTVIHLALICRGWGGGGGGGKGSAVGPSWVAQAAVIPLALKDTKTASSYSDLFPSYLHFALQKKKIKKIRV